MTLVDAVRQDAEWVIRHYGSDAEEKLLPGSKAKAQADRIARFVEQWLILEDTMEDEHIDLIELAPLSRV